MSKAASLSASAAAPASTARNPGMIALIVGAVGLVVALIGLFMGLGGNEPRYILSYLIGGTFWLAILIGMLVLTMLTYIFDAGWAVIVRRQMEHALGAMKWMGLVFLPLFLVILFVPTHDALPWLWLDKSNVIVGGHTVGHDPLYLSKAAYLNQVAFLVRAAIIFGIFIFFAEKMRSVSYRLDVTGDGKYYRHAYRWSAVGIVLTCLSLTLFSIDWLKSLEYHWFSTMYGVWFFAACMRSATAAVIVLGFFLSRKKGGYLHGLYHGAHSYLLGCLLLAFTVFWAYISFSQYFLQYNANIPEEVYWYNIRLYDHGTFWASSWFWVVMALVFLYFAFPFLYLLFYKVKFGARIAFIGVWILVFHLLDLYWNILPQKLAVEGGESTEYWVRPFTVNLFDIAAIVGVGGIVIWSFLRESARHKAIPIRDPRINEALHAHE